VDALAMFGNRKILSIFLSVVIVLIAFYIFAINITNVSLPDDIASVKSDAISSEINIYNNYYGIPHIIAQSDEDMFFGLGYYHARDRLWQMDYMRRIAKGRLSEIYGSNSVSIDMFFKLLDLEEIAHKSYKLIDKPTKNALEKYAAGVNLYIQNNRKTLPVEFNIFDYEMQEWQAIDCMILFKLYAFKQSKSFFMDVIFGMIAEKIGVENALELIPKKTYPPYILSEDFLPENIEPKIKERPMMIDSLFKDSTIFNSLPILSQALEMIGSNTPLTGTNCWASRIKNHRSGVSILANDFHSSPYLPCQWYQVHLTSKKSNVIGLTMPGIPFVFSGRNDNISWGLANMMLDDCDFFIHEIAAEDKESFVTPDGIKKFILQKDTIIVKDSIDVQFYKYIADGSIVIAENVFNSSIYSDIHFPSSSQMEEFTSKYYLTFNWVGFEPSSELNSLYKIMFADNWNSFKKGLANWGTPAVNFVYSDIRSNIGLLPKGYVPIRDKNCNPNIPNPGWELGYSWLKIEKNFAFGNIFNPKKNYVAAANNALTDKFVTHLSSYTDPSSRAFRLEDFFRNIKEYQDKEIKQLQQDMLSTYAIEFRNLTIPILLESYYQFRYEEREAFSTFRDWDCILSPLSPAASLYSVFLKQTIQNVFGIYLNEENLSLIQGNSNILYVKLFEILSADNPLPDFISHDELNKIINISFSNAIIELEQFFETKNIEKWEYGRINKIELDHFLSNLGLYDKLVKIGPFEVGGDFSTLNYCQNKSLYDKASSGRTASIIINMSDSLVYTTIAGGSSGQPISTNYSDQIQLWLNGGYVAIPIRREYSADFKLSVEILPE
jgi:penicillin G amidase